MKFYSQLEPPVYKGRSFSSVEDKLEDCVCPSVRQILHRHVTGMTQIGNVYNEYDPNDPIIGNGIDKFDLLDAQIARQEELISQRSRSKAQRAKHAEGKSDSSAGGVSGSIPETEMSATT